MQQPDAVLAKRILKVQAILGLVLVGSALPFGGSVAISVLIGAGICLLANSLLAAWMFRDYRAQQPAKLVLRFYSAEALKIALTIGLFGIAYAAVEGLNVMVLLGAYFAVQVIPTMIAAQIGGRTTS